MSQPLGVGKASLIQHRFGPYASQPTEPNKRTLTEQLVPIQAQRAEPGNAAAGGPPPIGGGGTPLPADVRAQMEAALGANFVAVRVHVSPYAEVIGAHAFTRGTDLFFAPGAYDSTSPQGLQLLGHELVHVMQQAQGRVPANAKIDGAPANTDASLEQEADELDTKAASALPPKQRHDAARPGVGAPDRRDPPRPARPGRRAAVPPRPVLPDRNAGAARAAAARAGRGHPDPGRQPAGPDRRRARPPGGAGVGRGAGCAGRLPVASNLRELRNLLERVVLLCDGSTIGIRELRLHARSEPVSRSVSGVSTDDLTLAELDRRHIERVYAAEGQNVQRAAVRLGIPRSSLYQKLARLGLLRKARDAG